MSDTSANECNHIPNFFKEKLLRQYNEELTNEIIDGFNKKRKTTFRVNTIKTSVQEIEEILKQEKIEYQISNIYENAIILEENQENTIKKLDIYTEGKIYLQSISSMLPPIILEPKEKENILDMTAAPGGKTTEIAMISNNKALITACEKNKIRYERLEYNIQKQGAKGVNLMKEDSRNLSDFFSFDKILLDAPCSGSGTITLLNDNYKKYFTEELINRSSKTQEILLKKALKILRKNGELVYSTCSILQEENEAIIKKFLNLGIIEIVPINDEKFNDLPKLPTSIDGVLCVKPTELYEGFFVAKLKLDKEI